MEKMRRFAAALLVCAWLSAGAQKGEDGPATSQSAPRAEQRLDINHASLDELAAVPGLSRVWAARIVRFRPYRTKEDLLDKGIVPSAVYDHIKNYVIAHRDKPPAATSR